MTRTAHDRHTDRLLRSRTERFDRPTADSPDLVARGAPHRDVGYAYDLAGNVVAIRHRAAGSGVPGTALGADALDRAFTYDALNRLVSATGRECAREPTRAPWDDRPTCTDPSRTRLYRRHFDYDTLGNLVGIRHTAGTGSFTRHVDHDQGDNRPHSVRSGSGTNRRVFAYRYDACGNLVQEGGARHFEWDHADRLTGYRTQPSGGPASVRAVYLYDASGERVKKVVERSGDIDSTTYVDENFEHHRWTRGTRHGDNVHVQVRAGDDRLAEVRFGPARPDDRTPAVQYEIADRLGNSCLLLDADGAVVANEEYLPYGGNSFGRPGRKRYRFHGRERDGENGLSHHGRRYYSPHIARWTSCDPLPIEPARKVRCDPSMFPPGQHAYAAFDLNPLRVVDPAGMQPKPPPRTVWRRLIARGKTTIRVLRLVLSINAPDPAHMKPIGDKTAERVEKVREDVAASARAERWGKVAGPDPPGPTPTRVEEEIESLAESRHMRITKEGGFAKVGVMGFVAILTTAGLFLASDDKLDTAVGIGSDMALGALFFRLTGSGGAASILTMMLSMENDQGSAYNAKLARHKKIHQFIVQHFPNEYVETRHYLIFVTAKVGPNYDRIYKQLEYVLDHPYVLEEDKSPEPTMWELTAHGHIPK